ncbi:MAG TPA: hypothetical protein VEL03_07865 [Streptosporangiaceae bacterium]|nr:hypothetical protein [Streptosporangiaceae bacterium]
MSRAQERSSGLESGAQPTQGTAENMPGGGNAPGASGTTGSGNAPGASGDMPGTAGTTAGATSTGMSETSTTQTQDTGAQGTGARTSGAQATDTRASTTAGRTRETDQAGYRRADEQAADSGERMHGLGGVLSMITGALAFLAGLALVARTTFYPSLPGYYYRGTVYSWGWALLILGGLLFAVGVVHLLGIAFARYAAIGLCVLLAVAGFLVIPYVPLWSIILVALSVVAIWGLVRDGEYDARGGGYGYDESYRQGSVSSQPVSSGPRHRM